MTELEYTAEEDEVVSCLGEAWDKFLRLEVLHADQVEEFRHGIHRLQHIVMSRPVQRVYNQKDSKND